MDGWVHNADSGAPCADAGDLGDTKIRTSLGASQVAVGILFGGWSDSIDLYEESLAAAGAEASKTVTLMREVQQIGAALATEARSSKTLVRKRNPWDLGF